MLVIVCVAVLVAVTAAVPLERDNTNNHCPTGVYYFEDKCGVQHILDVMYPLTNQPPSGPSSLNYIGNVDRRSTHIRTRRSGQLSGGSNFDIDLVCKMYETFDRCLTSGYKIPEICLTPDVMHLHWYLSFMCGPGKQGSKEYLPCLSTKQPSPRSSECQKFEGASYSLGGIITALNLPLNDSIAELFSSIHIFWQITCNPSVYKTCSEQTYRKPCGEQAARFLGNYTDFYVRKVHEFVSASGDEVARQVYSCDNASLTDPSSPDPNDKPTAGSGIVDMISQAQSVSGKDIEQILDDLPEFVETYGPCGEITQSAEVALCVFKTVQMFPAITHEFAGKESIDIWNGLCLRVADQYMKCTAGYESTCTDGILSHIRKALSSTCSGLTSAVKNLKCRGNILDMLRYEGNCSGGWHDVSKIMQVHNGGGRPVIPKDFQHSVDRMIHICQCLLREGSDYVKKHAVQLCGESVVQDFVAGWEALYLAWGDVKKMVQSLFPPTKLY